MSKETTKNDILITKLFREYGKRAKTALEKKYGPEPYKELNRRSVASRKKHAKLSPSK